MAYLSGLHIYRMIYDYGNYTLDITRFEVKLLVSFKFQAE